LKATVTSILLLLLAAAAFAVGTFAYLERLPVSIWTAGFGAVTAAFLPSTLLSRRMSARWLSAVNVASGIAIGFLSYFVLAAMASWLAVGIARLAGRRIDWAHPVAALYAGAALVGLYALLSAFWIRVTRVSVALDRLPPYWHGRTLALVTDVHLGNFRGTLFSRRVVAQLSALQAEGILIGGDMFDGVRIDVDRVLAPWRALQAPSGVYFVGGNHDDYGGRNAYFEAIRRSGIRVLDNERVVIHGLQLIGVHDRETHRHQAYRKTLHEVGLEAGTASILLAHRPSNLAVPEKAGVSLQLSGHTHRGQFWPWTLVARRVHGKFAYGLNAYGRMQVFTSSGVGTWGPPFRLGTRSEVVLIRLIAA
jgi:predicted MPP superfamily phosphohydrolase